MVELAEYDLGDTTSRYLRLKGNYNILVEYCIRIRKR
jgi:hypothetical protein